MSNDTLKQSKLENIYVLPFKTITIMTSYYFSFIWMLKNSNKKSIWYNFKFKFQFMIFENECLLCQKESI
jgi:hypothetical protein